MKLKSIRYTNYRGLKTGEISFDDHLTVIVGKNGAGKSSVLSAANIAMSWIVARLKSDKTNGFYIEEDSITNGQMHAQLEADFDVLSSTISIPNKAKKGIQKKFSLCIDAVKEYATAKRNEFEQKNFRTSIPIMVYYGVKRAVIDIPLRINRHDYSLWDAYKDCFNGAANFRDFFCWFRNQEDIENEYKASKRNDDGKSYTRDLDAFRNALKIFMPEYKDIHVRRSPLRMQVSKHGETLDVNQLSDGEKIYLALIGDLCHRLALANPTLADPLQGEGIVLIDEIDLHLHPEWQGSFAARLTEVFPNIQFVITTHSPHVINRVEASAIRILTGADVKDADYSFGLPSEVILKDVMGLTNDQPEKVEKLIARIYEVLQQNNLAEVKPAITELENLAPGHPELTRMYKLAERLERRSAQ